MDNGCPNNYKSNEDVPGKSYYGRGYIQLTWAVNYKKAVSIFYFVVLEKKNFLVKIKKIDFKIDLNNFFSK